MKKKLLLFLFCAFSIFAKAQDVGIKITAINDSVPVNSTGVVRLVLTNYGTTDVPTTTLIPYVSFPATSVTKLTATLPAGWIITRNDNQTIFFSNSGATLAAGDSAVIDITWTAVSTPRPENTVTANMTFEGPPTPGDDPNNNASTDRIAVIAALPVKYGSVNATQNGSQLSINWSTLTETNNDRFLIELSKDGQNFKVIDSVSTKSLNGISDKELAYTYQKSLINAVSMLGVPATLGIVVIALLVGGLVAAGNKKRNIAMLIVILALAGGAMVSCNKKDKQLIETKADKNTKLWIRITQIDKDGTRGNQSQVIQVLNAE